MKTHSLLDLFLKSSGISIDTRSLKKGELFFALRGPNFDGNLYAEKALKDGAQLAIVDDRRFQDKEGYYWVPNVLEALQDLAREYRRTWDCPVVALTGSNGKTTTKELLAATLSKEYSVSVTQGNLNNHIGVPLTILRTPKSAEIAVIEMGANHQREIAKLCEIAEPTHGFITNIGRAHLEGFGGIEGVRIGKGELFDYLAANKGCAFVNIQDKEVFAISKRVKRVLLYSASATSGYEAELSGQKIIEITLLQEWPTVTYSLKAKGDALICSSNLPGVYNFQNIAQAAAVSSYFKVSDQNICEAISSYLPENQRSEIRIWNNSPVLFDVYNANPDSMLAALSWLESRVENQKVAILGELAELGAFAKTSHQEILARAREIAGIKIATIGRIYSDEGLSLEFGTYHFEDQASLRDWLLLQTGSEKTVVLIKGSRSNKLEQVLA